MSIITRGSIIYLGYGTIDLSTHLECEVSRVMAERIYFNVINGMWDGYYDMEQGIVYVEKTREKIPARILYSGPRIVLDRSDYHADSYDSYNARMTIVNKKLQEAGKAILLFSLPTKEAKRTRRKDRTILLTETSYLVISRQKQTVMLMRQKRGREVEDVCVRSMSLEL